MWPAPVELLGGRGEVIDVETEPDRWLGFTCTGLRDGWRDMAAFAERQHNKALREPLEHWFVFSADHQLGRAREILADEGIHVG